jgi:hypothetical protein
MEATYHAKAITPKIKATILFLFEPGFCIQDFSDVVSKAHSNEQAFISNLI